MGMMGMLAIVGSMGSMCKIIGLWGILGGLMVRAGRGIEYLIKEEQIVIIRKLHKELEMVMIINININRYNRETSIKMNKDHHL